MKKASQGFLKTIATRGVIAAIPVAMASAYASNLFVPVPPRMAAYEFQQVAEITVSPTTVGIAASTLYGQTKAQIDAQLDEMQALGVENIRVFVPWALIEFNPVSPQTANQYYWDSLDLVMAAAKERDMGVLAEVNSTPYWAAADGNPSYFGTATPDTAAFAAFLSDFVVKYGDVVSAYEIWNEPNAVLFSNPIDPAAYAALVKAAYQVIKPADPNAAVSDRTATVIAGAVGHVITFGNLTMDPVEFVQAMIAADPTIGQYFDALSYHPYDETLPFTAGNIPANSAPFASDTAYNQVKDLMALFPTKKVWLTEFGVPTYSYTYVDFNGVTQTVNVTQAQQELYIRNLVENWGNFGQAGPVFVYTGRDTATGDGVPDHNFGLWDDQGNPKDVVDFLTEWFLAHPQNPSGPTNPTDPTDPTAANPLAALFQAIAQQISAFIAQAQTFVTAFVQAIANLFASLGGPAVTTSTPLSLRVASVPTSDTPSAVEDDVHVAAKTARGSDVVQAAVETDAPVVVAEEVTAAVVEVATTPVVDEPVAEVADPVAAEPAVAKTPEATEPASSTSAEPATDSAAESGAADPADKPVKADKPDKADKTDKTDKTDKADKTDKTGKPDAQDSERSGGSARHSKDKGDKDVSATRVKPTTGSDGAGADKGSEGKNAPSSQGGSGSDGGGDEG
jgi:hypothetical protein